MPIPDHYSSTPARWRSGSGRKMPGEDPRTDSLSYRSEEHTSELQSQSNLVCRLLLEKNKTLLIMDVFECSLSRSGDRLADQHAFIPPDDVTLDDPLAERSKLDSVLAIEHMLRTVHPS